MRRAGLPIEMLLGYFKLSEQGHQTIEARKEILKEQRDLLAARIEEMQKTLDLLDYKINLYENTVFKTEREIIQIFHCRCRLQRDCPAPSWRYNKYIYFYVFR